MKVIFLDVDGVLLHVGSYRRGRPYVGEASCVAALNSLTAATNAVIVVSSCWRIGRTVLELRELLAGWGVSAPILDRTAHSLTNRGEEIKSWLENRASERGDVESFVIIDDDSDMGDLLPKLVQTSFDTGLLPEHATAAAKILMSLDEVAQR